MAKKKNKELKGLKRVNRIINEYLKRFGITASLGLDFGAYIEDRHVEYAILVADPADKFFVPFVASLAPNLKADIFLTSLFHEVGHIYTQYDLSKADWDFGWDEKEDINKKIQECPEGDTQTVLEQNFRYFNLPEEIAATKWAIRYMENYAEDVAEFWAELQPAILRFFRKNGLLKKEA